MLIDYIEQLQYEPNKNMLYYDRKDLRNTPSIRDGLEIETERRYRKEGARFIMECGTRMALGHQTIATSAIYFHRFYMFQTFQEFPRYVTASCCLFLAGKVEETPKKCRDIIATARSILTDPRFQAFSEDLRKAKDEIMTLEKILLKIIKFDLEIEHPYNFLLSYAKCLKGDKEKLQQIVQMAWNFMNDSLSTTVCLQWEPEIIAVAMIHLACKLSKFTVDDWVGKRSKHLQWWDMYIGSDRTMEILDDICHQVLDLYQQPNQQVTQSTHTNSVAINKSNATTVTGNANMPASEAQGMKPRDRPQFTKHIDRSMQQHSHYRRHIRHH
ncbi:cyclin-K-like [Contarinia nasturtii]|uniref:cyclin-K-like n=1 Tax=Contarinia nasturtii TaxID=265458 RepID=UPI0012D37303|nr:cyclin-K-like [Contarinia nasturtii]